MFEKGNKGGPKGISGRKTKAEELGLPRLLEECWTLPQRHEVIAKLHEYAISGGKTAVSAASLLLAYAYGKPTEKIQLISPTEADNAIISALAAYNLPGKEQFASDQTADKDLPN